MPTQGMCKWGWSRKIAMETNGKAHHRKKYANYRVVFEIEIEGMTEMAESKKAKWR